MTDKTINWVFRATDRTTEAFRSIDSKIAGITKSLRSFAGFAGFAAIAGAVGTLTRELVQMGSELQDASEKLGVSAETLQVLKFAAEQTGASFESLQSALAFNSKLTGEASRGNKEAAKSLELLGISAQSFINVPIDRRLGIIADRLAKVKDPAERLDYTLKILGRGAADLVPLLSQGSEGIAKFEEQLRKTNSILSNEQVKALDDAGDAWSAFILRLKVNAAPVLTATIGLLEGIGKAFDDTAERLGKGGTLGLGVPLDVVENIKRGPQGNRAGSRNAVRQDPMSNALLGFGKEAFKSSNDDQSVASRLKVQFDEVDAYAKKSAESVKAAADAAKEYGREVADVTGEIAKLGKEANSYFSDRAAELSEKYKAPIDVLTAGIREINDLFSAGLITPEVSDRAVKDLGDTYSATLDQIKDKNVEVKDSTQEMFDALKLSTDGYARDLTDAFFDATQTIGDYFKNLAETIAKALFTQAVTEPLISSILGSIAGSLGGSSSTSGSSTQYTRRAIGGPVNTGVPVLVGEQGPEMFIPKTSGTIIPHGISKKATVLAQTIASKIFVNPKIEKQINNILSAPARAMGGPVHLGTTYLVGERGPEIFIKSGGTIINNSATDRLINVAHNLTTSTDNRRSNAAHNLTTITDNRREFDLSSAITKAAYVTFINNQSKSILSLAGFKLPAALSAPPVRRATGGPVHPWTAYLVGERGPEIFIPSTSTTVTNNQTDRVINQAKTMVSNHRTENVLSQSQTTNNQAEKVLNVAKTLVNNNQSSKVFNQASTLIKTTQTDSVLNRQTNLLTNNVINRNSHSSLFETISRASTINHGDPQITNVLKLIGFKVPAAPLPARAMGGPVSAGSSYLVGESGPELFVPHTGGTIVPNAADGDTIQVNMTINSIDPYTAAQTIANQERLITGMIRKATRRAGRRPALA